MLVRSEGCWGGGRGGGPVGWVQMIMVTIIVYRSISCLGGHGGFLAGSVWWCGVRSALVPLGFGVVGESLVMGMAGTAVIRFFHSDWGDGEGGSAGGVGGGVVSRHLAPSGVGEGANLGGLVRRGERRGGLGSRVVGSVWVIFYLAIRGEVLRAGTWVYIVGSPDGDHSARELGWEVFEDVQSGVCLWGSVMEFIVVKQCLGGCEPDAKILEGSMSIGDSVWGGCREQGTTLGLVGRIKRASAPWRQGWGIGCGGCVGEREVLLGDREGVQAVWFGGRGEKGGGFFGVAVEGETRGRLVGCGDSNRGLTVAWGGGEGGGGDGCREQGVRRLAEPLAYIGIYGALSGTFEIRLSLWGVIWSGEGGPELRLGGVGTESGCDAPYYIEAGPDAALVLVESWWGLQPAGAVRGEWVCSAWARRTLVRRGVGMGSLARRCGLRFEAQLVGWTAQWSCYAGSGREESRPAERPDHKERRLAGREGRPFWVHVILIGLLLCSLIRAGTKGERLWEVRPGAIRKCCGRYERVAGTQGIAERDSVKAATAGLCGGAGGQVEPGIRPVYNVVGLFRELWAVAIPSLTAGGYGIGTSEAVITRWSGCEGGGGGEDHAYVLCAWGGSPETHGDRSLRGYCTTMSHGSGKFGRGVGGVISVIGLRSELGVSFCEGGWTLCCPETGHNIVESGAIKWSHEE
ncbi:hypothetical protein Tco_0003262 [Tanacetum coccineum]